MRLFTTILFCTLISSCANSAGMDTTKIDFDPIKPYLPIFGLTENSSKEEVIKAYKESLNLMVIYSNKLEKELKIEKIIEKDKRPERRVEPRRDFDFSRDRPDKNGETP